MELPVYVTPEEVRRVCRELGIRDWATLTGDKVLPEEAAIILDVVNVESMPISSEDFLQGLQVELEHGTRYPDANVTNNHPILTGKIVMAHLKESLEYYHRLEVAEAEGDLFKAILDGDMPKVKKYYQKVVRARQEVAGVETRRLG